MTPQEVIKNFMARLNNHGYSISNSNATTILDAAIHASSRYANIQEVIDAMKKDQQTAEILAIQTIVDKVLKKDTDWYFENCCEKVDEKYYLKPWSEIEKTLNTAGTNLTIDDVRGYTFATEYTSLSNVIKEFTAELFLLSYCGINLNHAFYINKDGNVVYKNLTNNVDIGTITGSDSNIVYKAEGFGNDNWETICTLLKNKPGVKFVTENGKVTSIVIGTGEEKTADNIVPEDEDATFSLEDLKIDSEGYLYFDVNGLRVRIIGKREWVDATTYNVTQTFTKENFDSLEQHQQVIIAGLYKWWVEESLKLNAESYNLTFGDTGATVNQIDIYFENNEDDTLAYVNPMSRNLFDGETYKLELVINEKFYTDLTNENNYNGEVKNSTSYLDRTLAHEFTHALMAANVNYLNNLPKFINEGIAELTRGIDDIRGADIFRIAYDSDLLAQSLDTTRLSNALISDYSAGYMFLRYFALNAAEQTLNSPAFGEIEVDVDFKKLEESYANSEGGNLYTKNYIIIDTALNQNNLEPTNPEIFAVTEENFKKLKQLEKEGTSASNYIIIGTITKEITGYSDPEKTQPIYNYYYTVTDIAVKQNVQLGGAITEIHGVNANTKITGTNGNDSVDINEGNTDVNTGAGDDLIYVKGQYANINVGEGNDEVDIFEGSHHNINLGNGDNTLFINGNPNYNSLYKIFLDSHYNNNITGGTGQDIITDVRYYYVDKENYGHSYDNVYYYYNNELYKAIYNEDYLINYPGGQYYATYDNENFIPVTPYDFYQFNYNSQMDLGDGGDIINLAAVYDSTIQTGAGDDTIIISEAGNVLIDAGADNDVIEFFGSNNSIIGGAGDDTITEYKGQGAGNNTFIYDSDFGNDTIVGFMSTDRICLASGFTYEISESGTSYIVTVKQGETVKGTITITPAEGETFSEVNFAKFPDNLETEKDSEGNTVYLIKTVEDMKAFADYVNKNGDGNYCTGKKFKLANDIDFENKNYTPIGMFDTPFGGIFDGGGYTISNINCEVELACVGLFGAISNNSAIQNLNLNNCKFKNILDDTAYNIFSGSIVGVNNGTISNCHITEGTVSKDNKCNSTYIGGIAGQNNGTIENSSYVGEVTDSGTVNEYHEVGGIVGFSNESNAKIKNCVAQAVVQCTSEDDKPKYVGGIVGNNYLSEISDNLFVGKGENALGNKGTRGAIAGANGGKLENNFYANTEIGGVNGADIEGGTAPTETFTITLSAGVQVTGAGKLENNQYVCSAAFPVTISNFPSDGQISFPQGCSYSFNGSKITLNQIETVDGKVTETAIGTITVEMSEEGKKFDAGKNIDFLAMLDTETDEQGNPVYLIESAGQMANLAAYVNAGNSCAGEKFKLANDLDFENKNYTPIGMFDNPFGGTFDGNGHKISNINCEFELACVGLFGATSNNAIIQNVNLNNCEFKNILDDTAYNIFIGSLVGVNNGTISNCHVNGGNIVKTKNCKNLYIGGIAGWNNKTIENCLFEGEVIDSCTVTEYHEVGGIVGLNNGSDATVKNCVAQAAVQCTSEDEKPKYVGGIVGNNYQSKISNNLFVSNGLSGKTNLGAIAGANNSNKISNNYYYNLSKDVKGIGIIYDDEDNVTATNTEISDGTAPAYQITLPAGVEVEGAVKLLNSTENIYVCSPISEVTVKKLAATNEIEVSAGYSYNFANSTLELADGEKVVKINLKDASGAPLSDVILKTVGKATVSDTTYTAETETGELKISATAGLKYGTVTVEDSLPTADGKNLTVTGDTDGVTVTVANGAVKSITGLADGGSVTYGEKTYSHTITWPKNVTATCENTLTINGKTYYANDSTVAISGFGAGKEITFDSAITSLELYGENVLAKVGDATVLTLSGLTFSDSIPATWQVSGTSANFGTSCENPGARINGKRIVYQQTGYTADFTLENLAANVTVEQIKAAVDVNEKTVTVKATDILDKSKILTISNGYTLKLDDDLKKNPADATWTQNEINNKKYVYTVEGNTDSFTDVGNRIYYVTTKLPKITFVGLKENLVVPEGATLPSGLEITRQDDNSYKVKFSSKDVLDGTNVPTIFADAGISFTLEIADELKPTEQEAAWRTNRFNFAVSADTSDGFKVENNKLVYVEKVNGDPLFDVAGSLQLKNLTSPVDGVLTFAAENLGANTIVQSNAGNYAVNITGDMTGKTFNGTGFADTVTVSANNALIKTNRGDDTIFVSGKNVSIYGGAGDDEITLGEDAENANIIFDKDSENITVKNFRADTKIEITGESKTPQTVGNDIQIRVGNATLTLENAKNNFTAENNIETVEDVTLPAGVSGNTPPTLTVNDAFADNKIELADYSKKFTNISAAGATKNLELVGNELQNIIEGGTGNDTLNGGLGNDTLKGGKGSDIFVYSGGNDVITDYKPGEDSIKLNFDEITAQTLSGDTLTLTIENKGTLQILNADNKIITFVYENENITQKYFFDGKAYNPLAEGLSYNTDKTDLSVSSAFAGGEISVTDYVDKIKNINAAVFTKDLKIFGDAKDNSIGGGRGADSIDGGAGNDKLVGSYGADTLNGGEGNDTLTGGVGNDIFVYSGGDDVITDYEVGKDKIQFDTKNIARSTCNGKNVIITTNDGTLTISNAKDSLVTFINDAGEVTEKLYFYGDYYYTSLPAGLSYNATKTQLSVTSAFAGTTIDLKDYLPTVKNVAAPARSKTSIIIGNDANNSIKTGSAADTINGGKGNDTIFGGNGADSIFGGDDNDKISGDAGNDTISGDAGNDSLNGGAGNDSLNGGEGNDTLTGGNGNDVFIYEGGNDVITDYTAGETIKIASGTVSKTTLDGDNVVFTTDKGTLTVQKGNGKIITVTDSSGTKNYSRTVNLIYDSNFIEEETALDEITEKKYSVTEIQKSDSENISQDQNILTYGEDK